MNCPKCNAPLESDDVFCPGCGTATTQSQPPSPKSAKPKRKRFTIKSLVIALTVIAIGGVAAAGIFTGGFGLLNGASSGSANDPYAANPRKTARIETMVDYTDSAYALNLDYAGLFNMDGFAPCVKDGNLIIVKYTGEIVTATSLACKTAEWVQGSTELIIAGFPSTQKPSVTVYSVVNKEGARVIERQSNNLDVGRVCDGLIRIKSGEDSITKSTSETMWLNESGQIVIPAGKYRKGTDFINGVAYAEEGQFLIADDSASNKPTWRGFIDKSGNKIITLDANTRYESSGDSQYALNNGRIILSSKNYEYVVDTSGATIIPDGQYKYIRGALSNHNGNSTDMQDYLKQKPDSKLYFSATDSEGNGCVLDANGSVVTDVSLGNNNAIPESVRAAYYDIELLNGDVLAANATNEDSGEANYFLLDLSGNQLLNLGAVWGGFNDLIPGVIIYHTYNGGKYVGGEFICDYKGNQLSAPGLDEDTMMKSYSPYLWTASRGIMSRGGVYGIIQVKYD